MKSVTKVTLTNSYILYELLQCFLYQYFIHISTYNSHDRNKLNGIQKARIISSVPSKVTMLPIIDVTKYCILEIEKEFMLLFRE